MHLNRRIFTGTLPALGGRYQKKSKLITGMPRALRGEHHRTRFFLMEQVWKNPACVSIETSQGALTARYSANSVVQKRPFEQTFLAKTFAPTSRNFIANYSW